MTSKPEHYGIPTEKALWVFRATISSDGFQKSLLMIRDGVNGKIIIPIQRYWNSKKHRIFSKLVVEERVKWWVSG